MYFSLQHFLLIALVATPLLAAGCDNGHTGRIPTDGDTDTTDVADTDIDTAEEYEADDGDTGDEAEEEPNQEAWIFSEPELLHPMDENATGKFDITAKHFGDAIFVHWMSASGRSESTISHSPDDGATWHEYPVILPSMDHHVPYRYTRYFIPVDENSFYMVFNYLTDVHTGCLFRLEGDAFMPQCETPTPLFDEQNRPPLGDSPTFYLAYAGDNRLIYLVNTFTENRYYAYTSFDRGASWQGPAPLPVPPPPGAIGDNCQNASPGTSQWGHWDERDIRYDASDGLFTFLAPEIYGCANPQSSACVRWIPYTSRDLEQWYAEDPVWEFCLAKDSEAPSTGIGPNTSRWNVALDGQGAWFSLSLPGMGENTYRCRGSACHQGVMTRHVPFSESGPGVFGEAEDVQTLSADSDRVLWHRMACSGENNCTVAFFRQQGDDLPYYWLPAWEALYARLLNGVWTTETSLFGYDTYTMYDVSSWPDYLDRLNSATLTESGTFHYIFNYFHPYGKLPGHLLQASIPPTGGASSGPVIPQGVQAAVFRGDAHIAGFDDSNHPLVFWFAQTSASSGGSPYIVRYEQGKPPRPSHLFPFDTTWHDRWIRYRPFLLELEDRFWLYASGTVDDEGQNFRWVIAGTAARLENGLPVYDTTWHDIAQMPFIETDRENQYFNFIWNRPVPLEKNAFFNYWQLNHPLSRKPSGCLGLRYDTDSNALAGPVTLPEIAGEQRCHDVVAYTSGNLIGCTLTEAASDDHYMTLTCQVYDAHTLDLIREIVYPVQRQLWFSVLHDLVAVDEHHSYLAITTKSDFPSTSTYYDIFRLDIADGTLERISRTEQPGHMVRSWHMVHDAITGKLANVVLTLETTQDDFHLNDYLYEYFLTFFSVDPDNPPSDETLSAVEPQALAYYAWPQTVDISCAGVFKHECVTRVMTVEDVKVSDSGDIYAVFIASPPLEGMYDFYSNRSVYIVHGTPGHTDTP